VVVVEVVQWLLLLPCDAVHGHLKPSTSLAMLMADNTFSSFM
jgi:hypothetical protein